MSTTGGTRAIGSVSLGLAVAVALTSCTASGKESMSSSSAAITSTVQTAQQTSSANDQWIASAKKAWTCFVETRNKLRRAPSSPDATAQFKNCANDPLLYQSEQELQTFVAQGFTATGSTAATITGSAVTGSDPPTIRLTICLDDSAFGLVDSSGAPVNVSGDLRGVEVAVVQRYETSTGKQFLVQSLEDAPGKPSC